MAVTKDFLVQIGVDASGVVKGAKLIKKSIDGATKSLNEFDKATRDRIKGQQKVADQARGSFDAVKKLNTDLMRQLQERGKTQSQLAKMQAARQIGEIDRTKALLKQAGKLTLSKQKELAVTKQLVQQILTVDLESMANAAPKAASAFSKLGARIVVVNQAVELAGRAFATLKRGFDATVGTFADYETALVGVEKTTNISGKNLQDFGASLQELSKRIPVSTNELLNMAKTAGQLGVRGTKNLELFAETIAKVAVATNLTGEEAATAFTRILSVSSESIENIDEFASVIVRLGNNFAATESEITKVATETARAVAQFKVGSQDIAAISTALKQLGNQAQLGGSVVGKVFRTLDKVTRQTSGAMVESLSEITGIVQGDLRKSFEKSSTDVFVKFLEGLRKLDKAGVSISGTLERFKLSGDEVNKVIPGLAKRTDILTDALSQARQEMKLNTALNEEAAKAFGTLTSKMEVLKNVITGIARSIGTSLAPAVTAIVEGLTKLLQLDFVKLAADLTKIAVAVGLTIAVMNKAAVVTALSTAFTALGAKLIILGPSFAIVTTQVIAFGKAALLAAPRVALLAAKFIAIALAIDLVVRNIGNLRGLFDAAMNAMVGSILKFGSAVVKIFGDVFGLREKLSGFLNKAADDAFAKLGKTKLDFGALDLITEQVAGFTTEITTAEAAVKNTAKTSKKATETITDGVIKLGDSAKKTKKAANEALRAFQRLVDKAKDFREEAAKIGSSEANSIRMVAQARIKEIDSVRQKLKLSNQLVGKEKELLEAVSAINALRDKRLIEIQVKTLDGLIKKNDALARAISLADADHNDSIDIQLKFELEKLDILEKQLTIDKLITKELESAIDAQRDLLMQQAVMQRGFTLKDFIEGIKKAARIFQDAFDFSKFAIKDPRKAFGIDVLQKAFANPREFFNIDGLKAEFDSIVADPSGAAKQFGTALEQGSLAAGDAILSASSAAMGVVTAILNIPAAINQAADFVQKIADLPQAILDALMNLDQVLANFIDSFPAAMSKLADNIGPLIQSIISKIPTVILALIDGVVAALPQIIDALIAGMVGLAAMFPQLIVDIAERVPEIIEALVAAIPQVAVALALGFVDLLIGGGLEKIIGALIRLVPKIIIALVKGIANGLRKALSGIFKGLKVPDIGTDLGEQLSDGAKRVADSAKKATSQLFKVSELQAEARGSTLAEQISTAIISASNRGGRHWVDKVRDFFRKIGDFGTALWNGFIKPILNWFGDRGTEIWNGFIKPILTWFGDRGTEIWNSFIKPVAQWFGDRGTEIWDGLIKPVATWFGDRGTEVWNGLLKPIGNWFGDRGTEIWDGLLKPIGTWFGDRGTEIWDSFIGPIAGAFGDMGTAIWEGFIAPIGDAFFNAGQQIWEGLDSVFNLSGLEEQFRNMFARLDPSNLLRKMFGDPGPSQGFVESKLGIDIPFVNFAQGGEVPGQATVPGNSLLNDKVLSLLSPGEIVLDREEVSRLEKIFGKIPKFAFGLKKPKFIEDIQGSASSKVESVTSSLAKIGSGDVLGGIADLDPTNDAQVKAALDSIQDIGSVLPSLFEKFRSKIMDKTIEGMRSAIGMNQGGEVPGTGRGDSVLRMLEPKEFVINRSASQAVGSGILNRINQGQIPVNQEVNIELNITNKGENINESYIRQRLMPVVFKEFKRASTDGKFVISKRGIRDV